MSWCHWTVRFVWCPFSGVGKVCRIWTLKGGPPQFSTWMFVSSFLPFVVSWFLANFWSSWVRSERHVAIPKTGLPHAPAPTRGFGTPVFDLACYKKMKKKVKKTYSHPPARKSQAYAQTLSLCHDLVLLRHCYVTSSPLNPLPSMTWSLSTPLNTLQNPIPFNWSANSMEAATDPISWVGLATCLVEAENHVSSLQSSCSAILLGQSWGRNPGVPFSSPRTLRNCPSHNSHGGYLP